MSAITSSATAPLERTDPSAVELAAAKREYAFIRRLLVLALWVGSALALSLNLADPDLWGHVRYGQDWLAEGELPRTATHTFTAEGYRWINHENLAELLLALTYSWFGTTGLLVGKCMLGLGILGAMAWVAHRQGVKPLTMAAFLLLIANNLAAYFPVRPQLLSFVGMTLMLVVLQRAFVGWQAALRGEEVDGQGLWVPRRLWWLLWLVPVFVFWTNSHGGFAAGLAILAAYLGGRIVEVLWFHRQRGIRVAMLLGGLGLVAALASLANPYGYRLHAWLLKSLSEPRPEITEWAPPQMSDPVFWPFVALLAVAVVCWTWTTRRRDWVQIVIMTLVAWQACLHLRHIALVALLCGFWLPCHLHAVLTRVRPGVAGPLPVLRLGPWMRWGLAALLAAAVLLQSLALYGRLSQLPVRGHKYPIDAISFMHNEQLAGKLVVTFNWAQYALAALAPQIQVSFDGRYDTCYPQQVVDMNFDFLLGNPKRGRFRHPDSGPIDPARVLTYENPDLVLVDRSFPQPVEVMQSAAAEVGGDWTLLYQDAVAQLWGRRDRFDNPASPHYLPPTRRRIDNQLHTASLPWPALPGPTPPAAVAERETPSPPADSL